jgi:hypothetical protein
VYQGKVMQGPPLPAQQQVVAVVVVLDQRVLLEVRQGLQPVTEVQAQYQPLVALVCFTLVVAAVVGIVVQQRRQD